ncbi:hypothetical protein LIER_33811 [Lithospermum erythrorhizon]|uniref:Uncharacterized protein n=1 Tax=Lithospermum erythrorhizon TaxID=34254 RepID=A0AAV3RXQ7_LITER
MMTTFLFKDTKRTYRIDMIFCFYREELRSGEPVEKESPNGGFVFSGNDDFFRAFQVWVGIVEQSGEGKLVDPHRIDQDGLENRFDECHPPHKVEKLTFPRKDSSFDFINYVGKDLFSIDGYIKGNAQVVTKSI